MAERRMFAKTIIDSDAFLDMPVTAQLLYFHLAIRADDDGFINKPKSIMRMIGANQGDAEALINKKFIIPFDSGVVVIKHWNIHNYIRKDMYHETKYREEKASLALDENNAYTIRIEPVSDSLQVCDEAVTSPSTQVRLGKDRIGKDNVGEVNYTGIKDAYNTICVSFPKVTSLSDARKKTIRARLNTYSETEIIEAFRKAEASDFLKGKNNRDWRANFDWIMKDSNLAKVLDGNYDNRKSSASSNGILYCESEPDPEMDEFIRSIGGGGNG